jgi:hypothetical protein
MLPSPGLAGARGRRGSSCRRVAPLAHAASGGRARLPCVLEESPTVALGLGGGAAAVEPPCSSPLDADEIARIRLDTGVLQGARIALPDNELLSILDMEA